MEGKDGRSSGGGGNSGRREAPSTGGKPHQPTRAAAASAPRNDPLLDWMEALPDPPSHKPEDTLVEGLSDEDKKRVERRKEFIENRRGQGQSSKTTPYKTEEQYNQCLEECLNYGYPVDMKHPLLEYIKHPLNHTMYRIENKDTGAVGLWTRNPDGTWKRNLHRGMYWQYFDAAYKKQLNGELAAQYNLETDPDKKRPETNKEGFLGVVRQLFNMSREHGQFLNDYWNSQQRIELGKQWKRNQTASAPSNQIYHSNQTFVFNGNMTTETLTTLTSPKR